MTEVTLVPTEDDRDFVASPRRREQWRAHYATAAVTRVMENKGNTESIRKSYVTRAQSLPAMIQNMGLAGTIAFLLSKEDPKLPQDPNLQLVLDLSEWLLADAAGIGWTSNALKATKNLEPKARLEAAISHKTTSALTYRRAVVEAKRYATWIKRWTKTVSAPDQASDSREDEMPVIESLPTPVANEEDHRVAQRATENVPATES
jgi:CRISPR type III-B/RAMP module-associated protein Cmr5